MGHRSVALTWSSVVDDRPDRSSRTGRRHRRNVWCECSSKSIHCSKVHGSYHPRTIGLDSFTRRPVWTRRASHPAPSGRPPRGGATLSSQKRCFRYHIRIPCAFFYDNGAPATSGTRRGTRPNHFAAVVAGPNIFRWMSRPDVGRVWIGPIRLFRCTRVPGNFTTISRTARAIGRALFHKQEYQRAMIRWRAEWHENDRGSSFSRVP